MAFIINVASYVPEYSSAVPDSPCGPRSPVSPFSPFNPLKAKLNVRRCSVPPRTIDTLGVPIVLSTVAVAETIDADCPSFPGSPLSPFSP